MTIHQPFNTPNKQSTMAVKIMKLYRMVLPFQVQCLNFKANMGSSQTKR